MSKIRVWGALLALPSAPALAQANLGQITAPRINRIFYVQPPLYPTIQSALTAACALTNAAVEIPYGSSPTDTIAAASGCSTVIILDRRGTFDAFYTTTGSTYSQLFQSETVANLIDNGNASVAGTFTVTGATTLNGGGTLGGTYAGSPTFSGTPVFQNPPNFSSTSPQNFAGAVSSSLNFGSVSAIPSSATSVMRSGFGTNASGLGETDFFDEYIQGNGAADAFEYFVNTPSGYALRMRWDTGGTIFPAYGGSFPHFLNNTGLQFASATGCTFAAGAIGNNCTTNVTFPITELDTSAPAVCQIFGTTGVLIGPVTAESAAAVAVLSYAINTSATGGGTIKCWVGHN